ncbi:MAG: M20/M25/M40 family metallo-hydrolase [Microgenomates group bacterium]
MKQYLALLAEYISFKSISTNSAHKEQVAHTADWLHGLFSKHAFSSQLLTGYGNPIILASHQVNESLPTCLIYGHYDVQPADASDSWESDPFALRNDGKKLYARGVADNKGQTLIHMVSVFDLIKENKLGMNVIFLIEGDEETGGADFNKFMADHKEKLQADFVLISDGEMKGNKPTIEAGLRGGFNMTLTVTTGPTDLHSGLYGSAVPNAIHELSKIISKIHGEKNKIAVPEFYDNVDPLPDTISSESSPREHALENFSEYDFYTQTGLMPAIEVSGIQAGYMGEGYRNSMPASATAKINVRLVKSQEPAKLFKLFEQFVQKELPPQTSYTLHYDHAHNAIKLDTNNQYVQKASKTLHAVYGQQPLLAYSGGAIPIVELFTNSLKIPTILANLANEDCNMHAPNENFDIEFIKKGLEFSQQFFS